jgi:hypothetical protein
MANTDAPMGFRPINRDGSPYNGATIRCHFPATDTTAAFIGDAVKLAGTSLADGAISVAQAAAGDDVFGVVTAFEANPDGLKDQYRKASTARYCQVATADSTYFEAQDDGTIGITSAGFNANFIVGSGDTAYGISAMEIDSTTEATTNTLDLQLVAPVARADNDPTAANANWIVKFNVSQSRPGRTGVA